MAFRAFRPQSASMVPFKKCKANKMSFDFDKHLKFDRWSTMYKENFAPSDDKSRIAKVSLGKNVEFKTKETDGQKEKPYVTKVAQNDRRPSSAFSSQRKTKEDKRLELIKGVKSSLEETNLNSRDNHTADQTRNLKQSNEKSRVDSQTLPTVSIVKQNEIPAKENSSFANALSQNQNGMSSQSTKHSTKPRPSTSYQSKRGLSDSSKQVDELIEKYPNLKEKNEELPFNNLIGQTEEWLDVKDKLNPPVHSKLVNYVPDEFLKVNLKTLVNSTNEYYPFLTKKCLCTQCICGNCKCVHFKYKPNGNINSSMFPPSGMDTEYKTEFGPKKAEKLVKKIQPNEIMLFPLKIDFNTSNSLCFAPPKPNRLNDHPFFLKAKINNLGPNVCYVPCPMDSQSNYRRDYPDWKCLAPARIQQFAPNTLKKNMPFMGKPVNKEYGAFHARGENPEPVQAFIPENKNNVFPVLAFSDEVPNQTEYKRNFQLKELGDDPLRHFKPIDNLELEVS